MSELDNNLLFLPSEHMDTDGSAVQERVSSGLDIQRKISEPGTILKVEPKTHRTGLTARQASPTMGLPSASNVRDHIAERIRGTEQVSQTRPNANALRGAVLLDNTPPSGGSVPVERASTDGTQDKPERSATGESSEAASPRPATSVSGNGTPPERPDASPTSEDGSQRKPSRLRL